MKRTFTLALILFALSIQLSAPLSFTKISRGYDGLNFFTSQNSGTLFGTLRDKDTGLPISGAQVTITNSATGDIVFTGTTDTNGDFKFDNAVQGTNYSVEYWKEHFYTVTMDNIVIGSMGFRNVNAIAALKTSANGGVGGTIITDDQMQIKNVDINVYPIGGSTNYNTKTDDEGTFLVPDLPPAEYNVWPSSGGSQLANSVEVTVNEMVKWSIFENVTSPLNSESGTMTFQVNAEDGSHVSYPKLIVPDVGLKIGDSSGQVGMVHIPEGTYTVTASAPDYYSDVITLHTNDSTVVCKLKPTVENKAKVTGNVRDASSNEPVADVNVEIKLEEQSFATTTSANGDFEITDVPALGSYTATYSKTGYHTTVQKRGIETTSKSTSFRNVLLANKVEGHGAICIKVQSKLAQENINNILIHGYNPVMGFTGTVYVDADIRYLDGEIIITKVPVNAHLLLLYMKDGTIVQLRFNVEECHMEEFFLSDSMIISEAGSKIFGKAKDQSTGNSTGTCSFSPVWGGSSLYKTNEETSLTNLKGEFIVDNLTPETPYLLNFSADGINTTQIIINSPEENNAVYNEILTAVSTPGNGAVAGIIEGLGLEQHATVQISSDIYTTTVDDNSYLINDIAPGDYTVTAIFGGVEKQENVTIESGITKQINFDFYAEALTSVEITNDIIPSDFALLQNYPNPFNPSTMIHYSIPSAEHVKLGIYDLLGRELITLVNKNQPAGNYEVEFIAPYTASGIYIYKLEAGSFVQSRKMLLLK